MLRGHLFRCSGGEKPSPWFGELPEGSDPSTLDLMDRNELETYQVQLAQVDAALAADPENAELKELKTSLLELVELTRASIAAEPAAKPSTSKRKEEEAAQPQHSFQSGDDCLARYSRDNQWYPAKVASVGGSVERRVYSVMFKGYNTIEVLGPSELKPLPANYSTSVAGTKRKLSKEEEDERERKKKRNDKKLEVRAHKAQEQTAKQSSWQKFAKKAEKKGIVIAGTSGTSIFKTPDNAHGKGQSCVPHALVMS